MVEQLGEPDGVIAFDPSSFPKRGTRSVGVKRQWCSHRGKVDNCQVGVFMGYVSRHDHALLDFRLSLPKEWARDQQQRQACHVPEDVAYRTRPGPSLDMLDLWGAQVPHGWVTGDDELGRHTWFRGELRARGECYVLGVPCTTTIRDLEAPVPAYQGRGRPPKAPWQSVRTWRPSLTSDGWTGLSDSNGVILGVKELRFIPRRETCAGSENVRLMRPGVRALEGWGTLGQRLSSCRLTKHRLINSLWTKVYERSQSMCPRRSFSNAFYRLIFP